MKLLEKDKIREEIVQIKDRIVEKQKSYVEKYCTEPSIEFQKEIFELMLSINQKVTAYEFMISKEVDCFTFLEPNLNTESILKNAKKAVERLESNYYRSLFFHFYYFVYKLSERNDIKLEEVKELKELLNHLNTKFYIENHVEYLKVKDIITLMECISEIPNDKVRDTYKLLGIREVLLQYEKHLEDIFEVCDINLKRAVVSYLDDNVGFYFVNFI